MNSNNRRVRDLALIERLFRLDRCAISDALDQLGIDGVAFGLRAVSGARRIAGRAVTVKLGETNGQPTKRHLCTAAVDASGVIAHEGRLDVAGANR